MRILKGLISEPWGRSAAGVMEYVCYFLLLMFTAGLVLSLIGRQTFVLHTGEVTYPIAIYAEKSHEWSSRGPTASMIDDIHVYTLSSGGNKIDILTQVGLSAMYAFNVIPLIICFWLLSRVFRNISKGSIFTDKNALYLLYYGLIQIALAIFVPLIKTLICRLVNLYTTSPIRINNTGQNAIQNVFINVAFIVAAYIIHYGVHLQDEADHTL